MGHYKEKLSELVTTSSLDDQKKMLWELFLKISLPEEEEAIYEATKENEQNLNLLSDHLKGKIEHTRDSDPELWERLTEGEKRFIDLVQ